MYLPFWEFICLPVWLVVSGSSAVSNSFPTQFTVGVPNSILRCVRLVSGAVSASLGYVSPIICLQSFVSHLHSWVHCVRLSGCLSVLASVPLVPPTLASGVRLFRISVLLYMFPGFPFMCLPLSCFRASGGLSSLVSLCLSSSLALDAWWCPAVQISFFSRSCFSYHFSPDLYMCLTTHLSSIISLPQRWCLILLPVRLCAWLPSYVFDHVSPTSWVFPFICSPTGGVLFLFQHIFVISPLSLFFSPLVSS